MLGRLSDIRTGDIRTNHCDFRFSGKNKILYEQGREQTLQHENWFNLLEIALRMFLVLYKKQEMYGNL